MSDAAFYPCPCCEKLTLDHPDRGSYQTCMECCWEDDPVQLNYPDDNNGANRVSLDQARKNYQATGCSDPNKHPKKWYWRFFPPIHPRL